MHTNDIFAVIYEYFICMGAPDSEGAQGIRIVGVGFNSAPEVLASTRHVLLLFTQKFGIRSQCLDRVWSAGDRL